MEGTYQIGEAERHFYISKWKASEVLYIKKQKSKNVYESEVTVYECESFGGCKQKKCTSEK